MQVSQLPPADRSPSAPQIDRCERRTDTLDDSEAILRQVLRELSDLEATEPTPVFDITNIQSTAKINNYGLRQI